MKSYFTGIEYAIGDKVELPNGWNEKGKERPVLVGTVTGFDGAVMIGKYEDEKGFHTFLVRDPFYPKHK